MTIDPDVAFVVRKTSPSKMFGGLLRVIQFRQRKDGRCSNIHHFLRCMSLMRRGGYLPFDRRRFHCLTRPSPSDTPPIEKAEHTLSLSEPLSPCGIINLSLLTLFPTMPPGAERVGRLARLPMEHQGKTRLGQTGELSPNAIRNYSLVKSRAKRYSMYAGTLAPTLLMACRWRERAVHPFNETIRGTVHGYKRHTDRSFWRHTRWNLA